MLISGFGEDMVCNLRHKSKIPVAVWLLCNLLSAPATSLPALPELPALPPLPSLNGEQTTAEGDSTVEKIAAPSEGDIANNNVEQTNNPPESTNINQLPKLEMPDFGLFNPAELPEIAPTSQPELASEHNKVENNTKEQFKPTETASDSTNIEAELPPFFMPELKLPVVDGSGNEEGELTPDAGKDDSKADIADVARPVNNMPDDIADNISQSNIKTAAEGNLPDKSATAGDYEVDSAASSITASNSSSTTKTATGLLAEPNLPALPNFTDLAEPGAMMAAGGGNDKSQEANILPEPELPEAKDDVAVLGELLPEWASDGELPSLQPLPEPTPPPVPNLPTTSQQLHTPTQETVTTQQNAELPTISQLEETVQPESDTQKYAAKEESENIAGEDAENNDDIADKTAEKQKQMVKWPDSFKTYRLPHMIYRKNYSPTNKHLPKAVYHQEMEGYLFQAVAANNINGMRALLAAGVPMNIRTPLGETLLMVAISHRATDAARLLLFLGADPNEVSGAGRSALHIARQTGQSDMVLMLQQAGAVDHIARAANGFVHSNYGQDFARYQPKYGRY